MNNENNYGFLNYNYYDVYDNDPLYVLMVNEQFQMVRECFYNLDDNIKNILDYFIIKRNHNANPDINIDQYIEELKKSYFYFYYQK